MCETEKGGLDREMEKTFSLLIWLCWKNRVLEYFYKTVKFVVHHNGYFLEYSVFVTGGSRIFIILTVLFYPTPKCWVLIFVVCWNIPVSVVCSVAGINAINIINQTYLKNVHSLVSFVPNNLLWCFFLKFYWGICGHKCCIPSMKLCRLLTWTQMNTWH